MSTSHQSMILGKSNKMIDAKNVLLGEANDTSGNSTKFWICFKNQITGGNNNIAFGNTSVLKTMIIHYQVDYKILLLMVQITPQ